MKKRIAVFIMVVMAFSQLFAISLAKITTYNGYKIIYSSMALIESDFEGSNFFMKNAESSYYKDLNVSLFNLIKSRATENRNKGRIDPEIGEFIRQALGKNEKWKKKGVAVISSKNLFENGRIVYAVYNSNQKEFVVYIYDLDITQKDYNANCENKRYYEKCMNNIEWCNWVLENCSNPISEEAVAYNNQPRASMNLGGSYNPSSGVGYGGYETSGYERPKVSERNPNYDPDKVAEAKRILPTWKKEKAATEAKLKYLPFTLYGPLE
ncbi:MAG: hypothetical protein J5798_07905 [Spirochaetaceae bacterium]|nr:hypothetical protein [Spirochaetaceae bacterium]